MSSQNQIHDKMEKVMFKCLSDTQYLCYDSFIMYEVTKMKMSDRDMPLCNTALNETCSHLYEYDYV